MIHEEFNPLSLLRQSALIVESGDGAPQSVLVGFKPSQASHAHPAYTHPCGTPANPSA